MLQFEGNVQELSQLPEVLVNYCLYFCVLTKIIRDDYYYYYFFFFFFGGGGGA